MHGRERDQAAAAAAAATLEPERDQRKAEKEALTAQVAALTGGRDREAERVKAADARIEKLESRLDDDERWRKRNVRITIGMALLVFGSALAVVLPLFVLSGAWAEGGGVLGGLAFVLLGVRVAAGSRWGGEIATWGTSFAGIAAILAAIIVAK